MIKHDFLAIINIAKLEAANKHVEHTRTTFTQYNIIVGEMMVKVLSTNTAKWYKSTD